MLPAVGLNCKFVLRRIEIKNKIIEGELSSELHSLKLTVAKNGPKLSFCVSLISA